MQSIEIQEDGMGIFGPIEQRLPEYGPDAMAHLADEDMGALLRHVTHEVAVRLEQGPQTPATERAGYVR